MAEQKGRMEIEQISHDDARAFVKETYADADAAGRFFDQLIETRTASIEQLTKEVNGDERLARRFARDPLGVLGERKLLGPLDEIALEGLRSPFLDWPWPWPVCRIVCRLESSVEVVWVCVGFWPFRFCWPTLQIRWRWICRIVCD
jgi:hypothetical protein